MTAWGLAKQLLDTYVGGHEDHSGGLASLTKIPPAGLAEERFYLRLFLADRFTWIHWGRHRSAERDKLLDESNTEALRMGDFIVTSESILQRFDAYLHAVQNPHPTLGEAWSIGEILIERCQPCVATNTALLVAAEYAFASTLFSNVCSEIAIA